MKQGDTFYCLKGPGKPYKCHVKAIVDDKQVVYAWYGRHKQWWHYNVEHINIIELYMELYDKDGRRDGNKWENPK